MWFEVSMSSRKAFNRGSGGIGLQVVLKKKLDAEFDAGNKNDEPRGVWEEGGL